MLVLGLHWSAGVDQYGYLHNMPCHAKDWDSDCSHSRQMKAAIAVERSADSKLSTNSQCSATYAAQSTCPADCPYRDAGCYAEHGNPGTHTRRINQAEATSSEAIRQEVRAIDKLSGTRPLRLHVVGDCRTDNQARQLAAAAERYTRRGETT